MTPIPPKDLPISFFLFADDFTYDAIHALGNEIIRTPNLDQLVNSGVTFTHAYNMGGWHGAICVASRSMIISGVSLWPARDVEMRWHDSDGKAVDGTWGKMMENAGYDTYMTGKWHVKAAADQVFMDARDVKPGMPPDYWVGKTGVGAAISKAYHEGQDLTEVLPLGYNRPQSEYDTAWSATDPKHGGYWEGGNSLE